MSQKPVVLLSGFGPFGIHRINSSWESVKSISRDKLEQKYNIKIVTTEIPVIYDEVDKCVPFLWREYNPMLVIHVGVSGLADKITLETIANGDNYCRLDCAGELPKCGKNLCAFDKCSNKDSNLQIKCMLDVDKICRIFNEKCNDIKACVSCNAGRYLCEYIYFTSLTIDASRTLFVHVPDINKPYSLTQISHGLDVIIELCIEQLNECNLNLKK